MVVQMEWMQIHVPCWKRRVAVAKRNLSRVVIAVVWWVLFLVYQKQTHNQHPRLLPRTIHRNDDVANDIRRRNEVKARTDDARRNENIDAVMTRIRIHPIATLFQGTIVVRRSIVDGNMRGNARTEREIVRGIEIEKGMIGSVGTGIVMMMSV